jgi:hypothetical protein
MKTRSYHKQRYHKHPQTPTNTHKHPQTPAYLSPASLSLPASCLANLEKHATTLNKHKTLPAVKRHRATCVGGTARR